MLTKKKFTEALGENIKKERLKKGLTQDALAHECGFYRTYINLVETAKRTPSTYSLYRIAKALKISTNNLYPTTLK
jgi:transcriptional regulator with XRE-family HTH domain